MVRAVSWWESVAALSGAGGTLATIRNDDNKRLTDC